MRRTVLNILFLLFSVPVSAQAGNEIIINEIMYNNSGDDIGGLDTPDTAYNNITDIDS